VNQPADTQAAANPVGNEQRRVRLSFEGLVQGVGFRPTVSRLANALQLSGWVRNTAAGVSAEVQGPNAAVQGFLHRLPTQLPPLARIDQQRIEIIPVAKCRAANGNESGFAILDSQTTPSQGAPAQALMLPDVAVCDACLADIRDPQNRRYRYPFTNCTHCGPRFSILQGLPYDRARTTMRRFVMCPACQREYDSPLNRRYHAQPNACANCGPKLTLLSRSGEPLAEHDHAMTQAADALRAGKILAVKGLGGYQLLADASNEQTIALLRTRKRRPHKPFALMVPALRDVRRHCAVSPVEHEMLLSPAAPIVLLRRSVTDDPDQGIARSVAPGLNTLGFMIACTPLHQLLIDRLGFAVVATSGNLTDEPMVTEDALALSQLGRIADLFLTHDRAIACPMDDSVVRDVAGRALVLRRARGFAPLPVRLRQRQHRSSSELRTGSNTTVLALGGHQKSAIALARGDQILVGPHVADLDTERSRAVFDLSVSRLRELHDTNPDAIATDTHPDYYSREAGNRLARKSAQPIRVQHHLAHIMSCVADNQINGPVLGIAWDGSGLGDDGTIWGGECMVVQHTDVDRVATLRPFMLPGAQNAVNEPRRSAIGLLHELNGSDIAIENPNALTPTMRAFSEAERTVLAQMLHRGFNAPRTSSVGRLFDAVASLIGLAQTTTYQGQAAMALEAAAENTTDGVNAVELAQRSTRYQLDISERVNTPALLDWGPMIRAILSDLEQGISVPHIAVNFHAALARSVVAVARKAGQRQVVLTGGCFQNRVLTEMTVNALRGAGFKPFWHRRVPPNDGGLSLGQAAWVLRLQSGQVH